MPRANAPELRRRVIDLIEAGKTVAEVAAMDDPTEQTIHKWWNRHLVDAGCRAGTPTIENSEPVAARKRIADLENELEATGRANELLKAVVPPKGEFEAIEVMAGEGHSIERSCRITACGRTGSTCGGTERHQKLWAMAPRSRSPAAGMAQSASGTSTLCSRLTDRDIGTQVMSLAWADAQRRLIIGADRRLVALELRNAAGATWLNCRNEKER